MMYELFLKHKNKFTLFIIVFLTIGPFFLADYLYNHQDLIDTGQYLSKGRLIDQNRIFNLKVLNLKDYKTSKKKLSEWQDDKWHILYFPGSENASQNLLTTMQNLNIALGKDEKRVQRAIVVEKNSLNIKSIPDNQKFLSIKEISRKNY